MPYYSSDEFFREWRFSLLKDFHATNGEDYPYADGGSKEWGNEIHKIPYPNHNDADKRTIRASALSHDGKFLAISDKSDILVYNTDLYKLEYQLKGHVGEVGSLAFRPGDSNCLVSSASDHMGNRTGDVLTLFWDLVNYRPEPLLDPKNTSRISLAAVKSAVTEIHTLSSSAISVTKEEESSLANSFEGHVSRLISEKLAGKNRSLKGYIHQFFQSHAFSASGHALLYLPRGQRKSNGQDDSWKLVVYSPDRHEDMFKLSGHTDSIMWAGFNHDETLIGTCGWDKSIRIWNATDGSPKYKFDTEGQNWAGAFSPNGQYFVGTCGGGIVHVYDITNGTEYMTFDAEKQWCRALAWHPSNSWFAIGGRDGAKLYLVDLEKKEAFQHRVLGTELSKTKDENRRMLKGFLELTNIHIVDGGRKMVLWASGDGSADVYDLEKECKWRFARAGTMNAPDNDEPVTSKPGGSMKVWEDRRSGQVRIATVDGDAIRFWTVPLTV